MSALQRIKLPLRECGDTAVRWEIASAEVGPKRYALLISTMPNGKKSTLVLGWRQVAHITWGLVRALLSWNG